ncbi:MAG: Gar1/Naf1 family protein [Candidatus Thorarchaeota archaeon]
MKRLGTVLHVSKRGSIIVRTDQSPSIGYHSVVLDKQANKVGTVVDVFGPVKEPYVAVKPDRKVDAERLIGQILYLKKRQR